MPIVFVERMRRWSTSSLNVILHGCWSVGCISTWCRLILWRHPSLWLSWFFFGAASQHSTGHHLDASCYEACHMGGPLQFLFSYVMPVASECLKKAIAKISSSCVFRPGSLNLLPNFVLTSGSGLRGVLWGILRVRSWSSLFNLGFYKYTF